MHVAAALEHIAVGCNAVSNACCGNSAWRSSQCAPAASSAALCSAYGAQNGVALVAKKRSSAASEASPALLHVRAVLQHHVTTAPSTRITSVYLYDPTGLQDDGAASDDSASRHRRVLAGDSEGNVFLWMDESSRTDATTNAQASDAIQETGSNDSDWQLYVLTRGGSMGEADVPIDAASVSALTAIRTQQRWLYVVAFSDGHLCVFEQVHGAVVDCAAAVEPVATLSLGVTAIMESVASMAWFARGHKQEQDVMLASGGVDGKVYLFEIPAGQRALLRLIALEGHRRWIRAVDFERLDPEHDKRDDTSVLLASASQDHRVRLWKITRCASLPPSSTESMVTSASSAGYHARGHSFEYKVSFDALLVGHEDWVTSLAWTRVPVTGSLVSGEGTTSALVSSSMDNTIIVWHKKTEEKAIPSETGSSVQVKPTRAEVTSWSSSLRIGVHGGNGILASVVLPSEGDRLDLLALNYAGQLERWQQQPAPSTLFLPTCSLTGHNALVTDLSWSPRGDYLLSCSLDQTTRMIAPVYASEPSVQAAENDTKSITKAMTKTTIQVPSSWHEISRAQVHGYDINCATFIAGTTPSTAPDGRIFNDRFVCGADEKILRVFEAPDAISHLVRAMKGTKTDSREGDAVELLTGNDEGAKREPRVHHAYLPELSLTNKAVDSSSESTTTQEDEQAKKNAPVADAGYALVDAATGVRLPVGDTLATATLWPEQRKLYGHGNELLCVASNGSGSLIASACKSREEKFAAIWLWNTRDWSVFQTPLGGHKSSVVQLEFSPNDEFLISVSRDRHFCLFQRQREDGKYVLVDRVKAHKRIIWSCSWSPDSTIFATGARDQSFAIWSQAHGNSWRQASEAITLESAVTAVAFAPLEAGLNTCLLAVGLENGGIRLFSIDISSSSSTDDNITEVDTKLSKACKPVFTIPAALLPSASISRLGWSPVTDSGCCLLACASADHSVRLYRIQVN